MKRILSGMIVLISTILLFVMPIHVSATEVTEADLIKDEVSIREGETVSEPFADEINPSQNNVLDNTGDIPISSTDKLDHVDAGVSDNAAVSDNVADDTDSEVNNVATADEYVTFSGEFISSDDQQTYSVDVDFSTMDTAAICLVRTGYIGATIKVYDEKGTEIIARGVSKTQSKNWCFLKKPSENASICKYTIVAKPQSYEDKLSSYRIMVGEKSDAELMMSGKENVVLLDMYYEAKQNYERVAYTPNQQEYWFKYKYGLYNTITIMLSDSNVRFRIVDPDTSKTVYDSNRTDEHKTAHRTKFIGNGGWTCAEKVDSPKGTTPGKDYYLVVYNVNPSSSKDLVEKTFMTTVGKPVMGSGTTTIYATSAVSMSSSRYSNLECNVSSSTIPTTAKVDRITLGGITMSNVQNWRAMAPNKSVWKTSAAYNPGIDMGYVEDATYNSNILGAWQFAFKASPTARITRFTPYFNVTYYYAYGD